MAHYIYILRTNKNTLYTGYTTDIERRLREHSERKGIGEKYTRSFDSVDLVYSEKFRTRSEATKREAEIKKMKKADKEFLVKNGQD